MFFLKYLLTIQNVFPKGIKNERSNLHFNLHYGEYSQEFHYYPFAVKLDRCVGRCDTLNDLSSKVCIPNKTEDLNLSVFNMVAGINEWKILTKHLSCECKCKFHVKKCNSNQWWNNDKYRCTCEKHYICEKGYVWNFATCNCENGKYLASIMDDSMITCDEVIKPYDEKIKTIPTSFNEKEVKLLKHKIVIFYLRFY